MIEVDCTQGGEQWFAERLGKPSSSRFGEILTPGGEPSKQAHKYMLELAGEKIIGFKPESYQSAAMLRGSEMESKARQIYEIIHDVEVRQIGCCFQDGSRLWVSSPDGLIGDEGLVEIKCPTLPVSVEYLLSKKVPTIYKPQLQGQLLTTGRQWVDFFSYHPGLPPLIIRVPRNEDFIGKLETALNGFVEELAFTVKKLRDLGQ